MPEIRLFNLVIDSTLLMATLAIIGLIIAYLNYRKKPGPTFQNCTFQIQTMNPNDLSNESVVKKISDSITLTAEGYLIKGNDLSNLKRYEEAIEWSEPRLVYSQLRNFTI